jgi:NADH:ubiquinone oxidoreductase subunit 5 (subunit L)/multisubunit Na+/H+ antiporter MnhA subunit
MTAFFASATALVQNDLKRVIAYSTCSQLGYMVFACGTSNYNVGIFHLFNHAFFKALLFLGAGSLSHAVGTFDMKKMGGLKRYMPWTYMFFIIGTFSLVGFFPFSGFWSKDEILAQIIDSNRNLNNLIYIIGSAGVFFTSFYMFEHYL